LPLNDGFTSPFTTDWYAVVSWPAQWPSASWHGTATAAAAATMASSTVNGEYERGGVVAAW